MSPLETGQRIANRYVLLQRIGDGGHAAAANLNESARRRALEFTYLMQRLMD